MKALILNCTPKTSPETSNTATLAGVLVEALRGKGVDVDEVRLADRSIPPGVLTDMGEGDEWPAIHQQILAAEILIVASPRSRPTGASAPASVPGSNARSGT